MPRAGRGAVAGLVALALLVGCTEVAPPSGVDVDDPDSTTTIRPQLRDEDDRVLVLGDSLTVGADLFGDLERQLRRAGFDDVAIIAEEGRDTSWGIEQVEELETVPDLVVVELGTNPDDDSAGFAELVSSLVVALRTRGAERIAWLTPVHGSDDRYDDKVAIISSAAGIDLVADWATIVHDDPRRLAVDGLHPTEAGYGDLADFLVDTAADLAR